MKIDPALRPELWFGVVRWAHSDGLNTAWRLDPDEAAHAYSPELVKRAAMPAGVRVRFATRQPTRVAIETRSDGDYDIDLVIGGQLAGRSTVAAGRSEVTFTAPVTSRAEVWLPQWGHVEIGSVETDAPVEPSPAIEQRTRWVTYGSSITQCRTAAGPAETWPAIVARNQDWDLTCLGFGGECHLDSAVVQTVAKLEADVVSVCLGINVHSAGSFNARTWTGQVYDFCRRIRQVQPGAELVAISPIACPLREDERRGSDLTLREIREGVRRAVRDLADADNHVHLIDGLEILNPTQALELLDDGLHPGADGYRLMGARMTAALNRVLTVR